MPPAHHRQHPLLGLRDHDLVRGHPLLAAGHLGHVDAEAGTAAGGGLQAGRGEPGATQILDAGVPVAVVLGEVDAGLHEELLHEGVADLNGGPALLGALVELDAGEGGAVEAVAAGVGAD